MSTPEIPKCELLTNEHWFTMKAPGDETKQLRQAFKIDKLLLIIPEDQKALTSALGHCRSKLTIYTLSFRQKEFLNLVYKVYKKI